MSRICEEELEQLKKDVANKHFWRYVDTWEFEDDYSHNEIDEAREEFINRANEYFEKENLDYEAREQCENVMIFDKRTGERLYN